MLADPDIKIIEAFGIVNQSVPPDSPYYGFPYPGYYLVDPAGVVQAKYFNELNADRTTAASILVREFNADGGASLGEADTRHVKISWSSSNTTLRPGQRTVLVLNVWPKEGMHLYAPGEHSYRPVDWVVSSEEGAEVGEAIWPEAEMQHLPAIDETVPVYHEPLRILRDLHLLGSREFPEALKGKASLTIDGAFRYQACDARRCYAPAEIDLRWVFDLEPHDLVRVPEAMRRVADD